MAGRRPPIAKRVTATVAANTAGATLVSAPGAEFVLGEDRAPAQVGVLAGEGERAEDADGSSGNSRPGGSPRRGAPVTRCGGSARQIAEPGADRHGRDDHERRRERRARAREHAGEQARTTTKAENVPCARVMTGRSASCSARPATAFMATSAAPLAAPASARPGAERDEVARGQREPGARDAQQRDQARGDPQAPAVERPPDQQHRRQRARTDEQQREAELAVIDAGLVLDARDRRAPGAPERAEGGEGDVGGRDQAAGQAAKVAAWLSAP